MKRIIISLLIVLFVVTSCSTTRITADYDTSIDFSQYKTFSFYKKGIDNLDISDIDKKRIIKAIEKELKAKGLTMNPDSDLIVNIFANTQRKIQVYNNYHYGYYWRPYYYGPHYGTYVSQYDEGTLFIDFVDSNSKELVWQGVGVKVLEYYDAPIKDEKVKEFVGLILRQYPPGSNE